MVDLFRTQRCEAVLSDGYSLLNVLHAERVDVVAVFVYNGLGNTWYRTVRSHGSRCLMRPVMRRAAVATRAL